VQRTAILGNPQYCTCNWTFTIVTHHVASSSMALAVLSHCLAVPQQAVVPGLLQDAAAQRGGA
jgi:hypothetical protein